MSLRKFLNEYVVDLGPESTPAPAATTGTASAPAPSNGVPGLPGFSGSSPVPTPYTPSSATNAAIPDSALTEGFTAKIQQAYSKSPTSELVARFAEALESLKEFIPEEGNRFRAAMKQVHTTPQLLIQAYQSLTAVIDGEDSHFNALMEEKRKNEIGSREQTISTITNQIEAANNTIQQLIQQRDTVNGEIVGLKTKLDTAENGFDGAAKVLKTGLTDTINKINIYVPSAPAAK